MSDPLVEALRRLVAREGGYQAVADRIDANDQSIYQILSGVKLKSGKPKGVGPSLRSRLTAAYPNWLEQPAASLPSHSLPRAPPPKFEDRREVSESDWAVLQDVKLVLAEDELDRIGKQAERVRRVAAEQVRTSAKAS